MLFREHRELLEDSMKTVVTLNTAEEFYAHMETGAKVTVSPYSGADERIGWKETYIVEFHFEDGSHFVEGFTDGPIPE